MIGADVGWIFSGLIGSGRTISCRGAGCSIGFANGFSWAVGANFSA